MQGISKRDATIRSSVRNAVAGRSHPSENVRRNTGMHMAQAGRGAPMRLERHNGRCQALRAGWMAISGREAQKSPGPAGAFESLEELVEISTSSRPAHHPN